LTVCWATAGAAKASAMASENARRFMTSSFGYESVGGRAAQE
jgi:hypothetical protein